MPVLAVLAVVGVAVAVYLVARPSTVHVAGTPGYTAPPPPVTAVIAGDSFVQGTGESSPQAGFAWQVRSAMRWSARVDGESSTGYVRVAKRNPGQVQAPLVDRVARIVALRPDVVLLAAGRNDLAAPLPVVAAGAAKVLGTLHAALPKARVFVVGPWWWDTTRDQVGADIKQRVVDVIRAAAARYGYPFFETHGRRLVTDATVDRLTIPADRFHPDQAGHDMLARVLTGWLVREGAPRGV